jgi:hypothetical protein
MALTLAYIGWEEARLRIHCPAPIELDASSLAAMEDPGPVWGRLDALVPTVKPAIVTTESGALRGVWIPLAGAKDPNTAIAVVNMESLEAAKSLCASRAPLLVEGLASLPSRENGAHLRNYFGSSGVQMAARFRVLEAGRKPHGLLGSIILFLLGAAGAIASICGVKMPRLRRRSKTASRAVARAPRGKASPCAPTIPAPLPDEIKVQVRHMVTEIWDRV